MNQVLVDVYLAVRKPKWGKGLVGKSATRKKDLEEIILGDVALRDKQREEYVNAEFEKKLDELIKK